MKRLLRVSFCVFVMTACHSAATDTHAGVSAELRVSELWVPALGVEKNATLVVNGAQYRVVCESHTEKPLVRVSPDGTRVMYRCGGPTRGGFVVSGVGYVDSCEGDWSGVTEWQHAPVLSRSWPKLAVCTSFSRLRPLVPDVPVHELLAASLEGAAVDESWVAGFRALAPELRPPLRAAIAAKLEADQAVSLEAVKVMLHDEDPALSRIVAGSIQRAVARADNAGAERLLDALHDARPAAARDAACTHLHALGDVALRIFATSDGPFCAGLDAEILARAEWLCDGGTWVQDAVRRNGGPGPRLQELSATLSYALVADQTLACSAAPKKGQLCKCEITYCESRVKPAEAASLGCDFVTDAKRRSIRVVSSARPETKL